MLIKLLSIEIPKYWEIIKFTVKNVDNVEEENLQAYLNNILNDLLSDKAQCFFRIDPQKRLVYTVVITRIEQDKFSSKKSLIMQSVYSFRPADKQTREKERDFLKEFAKREGCSFVIFKSPYKIAWELGLEMGFKEIHRTFMYSI